jgi:uncharacterized membrane protein (DUF485 family)
LFGGSLRENSFEQSQASANNLEGSFMANSTSSVDVVQPKQYKASQSTWNTIARSTEFRDLMATKRAFVVPAVVFFVVYYVALPVSVGYAPQFMSIRIGWVNLAYLFALSQFVVAWIIAGLYVKAANAFDRLSKDIVDRAQLSQGGK